MAKIIALKIVMILVFTLFVNVLSVSGRFWSCLCCSFADELKINCQIMDTFHIHRRSR